MHLEDCTAAADLGGHPQHGVADELRKLLHAKHVNSIYSNHVNVNVIVNHGVPKLLDRSIAVI